MAPDERRMRAELAAVAIVDGATVAEACRSVGVSPAALYNIALEDDEIWEALQRAYVIRAWRAVDEIIEIADHVVGSDSAARVGRAKLRIEARQWMARHLIPQFSGKPQEAGRTGEIRLAIDADDAALVTHAPAGRDADDAEILENDETA